MGCLGWQRGPVLLPQQHCRPPAPSWSRGDLADVEDLASRRLKRPRGGSACSHILGVCLVADKLTNQAAHCTAGTQSVDKLTSGQG